MCRPEDFPPYEPDKEAPVTTATEPKMGSTAQNACFDRITSEIERENLDIFTEAGRSRGREISEHWQGLYSEAEIAVNLLSKAANRDRSEAIVDLLAREHPYLLNEIVWTTIRGMATRIDRFGGNVDGRFSPVLAEVATKYARPLKSR